MADKKISELPLINTISGSIVFVPIVHDGITEKITVEDFSKFTNKYAAQTGSAGNTFTGPQTINNNVTINGNEIVNGNVTVSGKLTVYEVVAQYETASVLFSSGSNKFGDALVDIHEFTGSTNITGSFIVNGASFTNLSSSNSTTFTNYSSSNSNTFTNLSSSNSTTFTNLSSSNSTTFTNYSSSNAVISQNYSASNSTTFTNYSSSVSQSISFYSSSNSTTFTNLSSSNSTTFTNYSSSNASTINNISSGVGSELARVYQTTASLNTQTGSQNSLNTSLGLITASIYGEITSINNVFSGVSSVTGAYAVEFGSINSHILKQATQTGSQESINTTLSIVTGSMRAEIGGIEAYTASLKSAIVVNGTNVRIIGELTASRIYTEFITSSVLFVTGSNIIGDQSTDKHEFTGSVHINDTLFIKGVAQGTGQLNAFTGSQIGKDLTLSVVTSSIDAHILKQATQTGSQDLVNLSISTYTGSQNIINNSVNSHILAQSTQTGSQDLVNLSISTYTGSQNIINSSVNSHILVQSAQTGSQDLVNLSISTFTGSLRSEVNLIEAYTASLKGATIVSSSQQIANYYKFAETASANTFYGNQTFASSGGSGLRVYGAAGTHQWDVYLNSENLRISDNTAGDAALVVDTRASFARPVTASALNLTKSPDGIFAELGGNTPKLNLYKFSSGNVMNLGHNYYYDGVAYGKNDVSLQGWEFRSHITNGQYTISHSPAGVTTLNQLTKLDANTGDLTITNGNLVVASGKGIDFSATSNSAGTMTSELLNDYEEGTWSPVITDLTNDATMDGTYTRGTYTKIGRQVTVRGYILTTSLGSVTGNVKIKGLPFTNGSGFGSLGGGSIGTASGLNITAGHSVHISTPLGQNHLGLNVGDDAAGTTEMTAAEWSADGQVQMLATYFVD